MTREGKMNDTIDLLAYLDYRAHAQKNGEMAWHWWALDEPLKDQWRKGAKHELIGDENPPKEPPNPNSDPPPPAKESER